MSCVGLYVGNYLFRPHVQYSICIVGRRYKILFAALRLLEEYFFAFIQYGRCIETHVGSHSFVFFFPSHALPGTLSFVRVYHLCILFYLFYVQNVMSGSLRYQCNNICVAVLLSCSSPF